MKRLSLKSFVLRLLIIWLAMAPAGLCAAEKLTVLDKRAYKEMLDYLMVNRKDITAYRRIFKALEKDDQAAAEREEKKLKSDILSGHVLAEKYLSKSYKSTYAELKEWLEKYNDHPQAMRIYRLAARKGDAEKLYLPCRPPLKPSYSAYGWVDEDCSRLEPAQEKKLRAQVAQFRRYIGRGKTKMARQILEDKQFKKLVTPQNYDIMAANLAFKYFLDNEDKLALRWASAAAENSGNATALWVAGLASWRLNDFKAAADYFSRLGALEDNDEWLVSAGAYWAYRAEKLLKNKKAAEKQLERAAVFKRTFYGILANHKLGNAPEYNWKSMSYHNDFDSFDYRDLLKNPALRRALVLIQVKNYALAEQELRSVYPYLDEKSQEAVLFIAAQYNMHGLAVKIARHLEDRNRDIYYDFMAYPLPEWRPKGGWKIEKSLVWAFVRQESSFRPQARSPAGARGLMQLLPSTAAHVAKDRSLRHDRRPLLEAEFNLDIGQKYIRYLLQKDYIDGNLFYLAVAYNAGPGNLLKWKKSMKYHNDPLLFIETVPSQETRVYIERVMANYWIYQTRLKEKNKSLEAVGKNRWPVRS